MKASEVINKMKADLFEAGWCKDTSEDNLGQRCLVGSKRHVIEGNVNNPLSEANEWIDWEVNDSIQRAIDLVTPDFEYHAIMGEYIPAWNDAEHRSFDQVIEMLDHAEKIALIREES